MDRDKRWERIKLAYDAMVNGIGQTSKNALHTIRDSYDEDITDEFIKPIVMINGDDRPVTSIKEDDVVIFFNFRTDRGRQLTQALYQEDFHEQNMHKLNLHYVTMTNYDDAFEGIQVIFNKDNLTETLGEVLEKTARRRYELRKPKNIHMSHFSFQEDRKNLLRVSPGY